MRKLKIQQINSKLALFWTNISLKYYDENCEIFRFSQGKYRRTQVKHIILYTGGPIFSVQVSHDENVKSRFIHNTIPSCYVNFYGLKIIWMCYTSVFSEVSQFEVK